MTTLEWLRATLMTEPSSVARLRRARHDRELSGVVTAIAAERGQQVDASTVVAAVAFARHEHHRRAVMAPSTGASAPREPVLSTSVAVTETCSAADVDGLSPISIGFVDGVRLVEWCDLRGMVGDDPFFELTIKRAVSEPYRALSLRWTTVPTLVAASGDERSPDLLIFHVSRCGSTLLSRLLAALPGARSISEAPVIEALISMEGLDLEMRCRALRAAAGALGRADPELPVAAGPFVLKLDSWSVLDLPLLCRAFPVARRMFLYRDPLAVIASHMRMRGGQMIHGGAVGGHAPLDPAGALSGEEYCAAMIARFAEAALAGLDDHDLLLDYEELPSAVLTRVLPHLGLRPPTAASALMQRVAAQDAKSPALPFQPGRHAEERPITDGMDRAARRLAWPSYQRLEARRLVQLAAEGVPC